jgi:hypothetical protein
MTPTNKPPHADPALAALVDALLVLVTDPAVKPHIWDGARVAQ